MTVFEIQVRLDTLCAMEVLRLNTCLVILTVHWSATVFKAHNQWLVM
jgi:hypothetical protein